MGLHCWLMLDNSMALVPDTKAYTKAYPKTYPENLTRKLPEKPTKSPHESLPKAYTKTSGM
jgi:hypothetical protein